MTALDGMMKYCHYKFAQRTTKITFCRNNYYLKIKMWCVNRNILILQCKENGLQWEDKKSTTDVCGALEIFGL